MSVLHRLFRSACVNCQMRFCSGDINPLMYSLSLGIGSTGWSRKVGLRIGYNAPAKTRLQCPKCLMTQWVSKRRLLWIEVGYWGAGLLICAILVCALALSLPPRPPDPTLEELLADLSGAAQASADYTTAVIYRAFAFLPLVFLTFWLLRKCRTGFVRLQASSLANRPEIEEIGS